MAYGDLAHCDGNKAEACKTCRRRDPVPPENTDHWFVRPEAVGDKCLMHVPRVLIDAPKKEETT